MDIVGVLGKTPRVLNQYKELKLATQFLLGS